MSHVVTVSRRISEHELRDALSQGVPLTVADEAPWGLRLAAPDDADAHIVFANGAIEAHGPDAHTCAALERLAGLLDAEVADEEQERLPPGAGAVAPVRQFTLFWPVACLILLGLLVWRW